MGISGRAVQLQVFPPIDGERFSALAASFQIPDTWKARPGQKPKPGKFLLYTDTYGPNYKYFSNWPKLKSDDGVQVVDSIEITVQGRAGLESIEDLGPPASIDAQRGFGLSREDLLEGGSAEVRSARKRKDSMGQVYYEWELLTGEDATVLVAATVSGGGLYCLAIGATAEQWTANQTGIKTALQSFSVASSEESSMDLSERIYSARPGCR